MATLSPFNWIGFESYTVHPASRHFSLLSSPTLAVRAMMWVYENSGIPRKRLEFSSPFINGISMSIIINSGLLDKTKSIASFPFLVTKTFCSCMRSISSNIAKFTLLSCYSANFTSRRNRVLLFIVRWNIYICDTIRFFMR